MTRKCWTKWICLVMAVVLLFAAAPVSASGEGEDMEWTYDNSIIVTILAEKEKIFSPTDFPGIDCKSVWVTEKAHTEQGVIYELILVLRTFGAAELANAIDILNQYEMIKTVQRNEKFAKQKSTISLNRSIIYLKVGSTAKISINNANLIEDSRRDIGISFSVDPQIYDADLFEKDSLSEYGISRFWPNTDIKEKILLDQPNDLEAQKSEDGHYYGVSSALSSLVSTVNNLAQAPGILGVSIIQMSVPGGDPPYENWNISTPNIIDCVLSGGETIAGFGESGPRINQTATVKGLKPGVTSLIVERGGFGAHASAGCKVIVYQSGGTNNPGDINHDGLVNASDALMALQHSVELITLESEDQLLADINGDSNINALDALIILQILVGIVFE